MDNHQGAFTQFLPIKTNAAALNSEENGGAEITLSSGENNDQKISSECPATLSVTGDGNETLKPFEMPVPFQPTSQDAPEDLTTTNKLPHPEQINSSLPEQISPSSNTSSDKYETDRQLVPTEVLPISVTREIINVPKFEKPGGLPLTPSRKSIGSKLDKIAQKLIDGMSEKTAITNAEEEDEVIVLSPQKNLPLDEEAVDLEGVDESLDEPPPERPFSELLPPNEDSQPEFVEELVSDNLPLDFGETLEENSETGSQNNPSEVPTEGTDTGISTPVASIVDDSKTAPDASSEVGEIQADEHEATVGYTEEPDENSHLLPADKVFEYQWPPETGGDIFMLQEQISEFLGIVSFKRKYPDLNRRPVEYKERISLLEKGAVTETQCDLGLTALKSEEVYELLAKDYPDKYKEYLDTLRERERKRINEANKEYNMQNIEKSKMDFFLKKAVRSAAEFNAQFMRERREERRAYFDLQTFEIQFPRNKYKPIVREETEVDAYPLALIPGQYQSHYKRYTPQELKYFPIKTALYSPHKALRSIYAEPCDDRDTAEEDKEDGSSSSDDSQSGSSDSEADSIETETASNKNQISEEQIKKLLATPRPDTPPKRSRKRASNQNGGETGDSEKDSEAPKSRRKVKRPPARRGGPGRGRKTFVKIPRGYDERCVICQEMEVNGVMEEVLQCSECRKLSHPSCVDMTPEMIPIIKTYHWQCMECKTCIKCQEAHDEDKMMFCDLCDRGYHTYCVGLSSIPPGRWECPNCQERLLEQMENPTPKKKGRQK